MNIRKYSGFIKVIVFSSFLVDYREDFNFEPIEFHLLNAPMCTHEDTSE